ncbi:hypothetical protein [Bradyrhizobium sp. HKCCYLS20291]|uniref:hypothetical protein n=1 Tax=Bradyrhizobium sp. HKCCYLS20291 TaxID=3420766 RepID=UPI003EB6DCB6
MEQLYAAAHAASRLYAQSWPQEHIAMCRRQLKRSLGPRLRRFYQDEIERNIDLILMEGRLACGHS